MVSKWGGSYFQRLCSLGLSEKPKRKNMGDGEQRSAREAMKAVREKERKNEAETEEEDREHMDRNRE